MWSATLPRLLLVTDSMSLTPSHRSVDTIGCIISSPQPPKKRQTLTGSLSRPHADLQLQNPPWLSFKNVTTVPSLCFRVFPVFRGLKTLMFSASCESYRPVNRSTGITSPHLPPNRIRPICPFVPSPSRLCCLAKRLGSEAVLFHEPCSNPICRVQGFSAGNCSGKSLPLSL